MSETPAARYLLDDFVRLAVRLSGAARDQPGRERLEALLEEHAGQLGRVVATLETEARLGRLAGSLARLFAAQSAPRAFCQAALDAIGEAMRASLGYVLLFRDDLDAATVVASRGATGQEPTGPPRVSRSLLSEMAARRQTLLLTDARDTPFHKETSVVNLELRSVLVTPLFLDGRVGGAIYLENATVADAFNEADRDLLEAVAQVLSPYIQVGGRLHAAIEERARLKAVLAGDSHYRDILGRSNAIRTLVATIERLKDNDVPVLVEGESGTGKELVARALHYSGRRAAGPLVTVNCAAIPEGLMESELLGHERGAFTGATERKRGKFEQASGGTLFLDEVGDLRYELQAKLLRILQEQSFERVGGSETIQVDVRLVAATNRDLRNLVGAGRFREDLFYRLYVVPIKVPALRDRAEDIPLLAEHFLAEFNQATGRQVRLDPEVVAALERYPFPGNVRELRNLVNRLVALAEAERVRLEDLPDYVTGEHTVPLDKDPLRRFLRRTPETNEELKEVRADMQTVLDRYVRRLEAKFLRGLLEKSGGNVSEAARLAGMNRTLFHRKLRESEEA